MIEQGEILSSLLLPFIDWMASCDYTEKEKEMLMTFLISKDIDEGTEDQLRMRKRLKLILKVLLESNDDINNLDSSDQTILYCFLVHYAKEMQSCSKSQSLKDSKIVELLVKKGSSIILLHPDNQTPLSVAIVKGRIDLVHIMLEYSAHLNTQNCVGDTILDIIIESYPNSNDNWENYFDYVEIIRNLVCRGANPNQVECTGMTPVHYAAKHCFVEILQLFKELGADFSTRTSIGNDLLMTVCSQITRIKDSQTFLKTINLLLRLGCNGKLANFYGFNCLHYASQSKQLAVLKRLVKAGAHVNAIAKDGSTPLHSATMVGSLETVQYLLDCGAYPQIRENVFGFTSLHTAAFNPDSRILRLIAERGLINLNNSSKNGFTALHLASMSGNIQVVEELIKFGADVHCQGKLGQHTPLHLASMRGHVSIMSNNWARSWKHGTSTVKECFKLVEFQKECNYKVINALVRAGADVNARNYRTWTPLHFATAQSASDVVEVLLKRGAFVNVQNDKGSLPLHNILKKGNSTALDCLLAFGADVNDVKASWDSFVKVMTRKKPIVNRLLEHVVELQAAGLPINESFKPYLDNQYLHHYHTKCLDEITKMKSRNLTSTMCFYDLLQMSFRQPFALVDSLPTNLQVDFPIYHILIHGSYRASRARLSLLVLAKSAFDELTTACWPDLCSEHIFQYLSNKDLRALVDSIELERLEKLSIDQNVIVEAPSSLRVSISFPSLQALPFLEFFKLFEFFGTENL